MIFEELKIKIMNCFSRYIVILYFDEELNESIFIPRKTNFFTFLWKKWTLPEWSLKSFFKDGYYELDKAINKCQWLNKHYDVIIPNDVISYLASTNELPNSIYNIKHNIEHYKHLMDEITKIPKDRINK